MQDISDESIQLRQYAAEDEPQVVALFLAGMRENEESAPNETSRKKFSFFVDYIMANGGPTVEIKRPSTLDNLNEFPPPVPFDVALVAVPRKDISLIVGFGAIALSGDGAELKRICVDGSYRRRGLGRMIVRALLCSTDIRPAWLTTLSVMYPACQLYQSLGFVQTGTRTLNCDFEVCHVVKYTYEANATEVRAELEDNVIKVRSG